MMRRQVGMTLIEMIVALAITAVVVGICTRCLTLGGDMRTRIESVRASTHRVLIAQELLRRMLHELPPQTAEGGVETSVVLLRGEPRALEIEAPHPTRGLASGRYRIRVEFVAAAGGRGALVLRFEPVNAGRDSDDRSEIELCRDLAAPVFEYLGETGWRNEWSETEMPRLVRMGAIESSDAGACWPELAIAPRVHGRPSPPEPRA